MDNEDAANDCVMNLDLIVEDDEEPGHKFYQELCKENQLLADFIKKCLKLENSIGMKKILEKILLRNYYAADKTARESQRMQKNLRRANYLLKTDPHHKFGHINDLCTKLKAIRAKEKDNNSKPDTLKRSNTEQLDVTDRCKIVKLDSYDISPFSETNGISFNDTCDTINESISLDTCSNQSATTEEDIILVPQRESPIVSTSIEKKLKAIESKIAYHNKRIAVLYEQARLNNLMIYLMVRGQRCSWTSVTAKAAGEWYPAEQASQNCTMLKLAAPKSKSQKNITTLEKSDGNIGHNNNHNMKSIVLSTDESEESNDSANFKSNDTNGIDKSNLDVDAKHKLDTVDTMEMFNTSGNNFTVTVEMLSDSDSV